MPEDQERQDGVREAKEQREWWEADRDHGAGTEQVASDPRSQAGDII